MTSGEPIEARLPYGQPFTISRYAKLAFNCNELPTVPEHNHAFFRRFLIVPFNETIEDARQDKQLASKIIADELPGVLNWALVGLARLLMQVSGLDTASSVSRRIAGSLRVAACALM